MSTVTSHPVAGNPPLATPGWHLAGLLVVAVGPTTVSVALDALVRAGHPVPGERVADVVLRLISILAATVWRVLFARPSAWWCSLLLTALSSTALIAQAALITHPGVRPVTVASVTTLVTWLALVLVRRNGLTPRQFLDRPTPGISESRQLVTVAATVAIAVVTCLFVQAQMAVIMDDPAGIYATAQDQAIGITGPLTSLIAALWTVIAEELLLVGAVTVLADRAGWVVGWIYLLSVGTRVALHGYLGWAALPTALLGVVFLLLYRRTGLLLLLVVVHAAADLRDDIVHILDGLTR
ncbi:CPBP family glutamic-type intramembrane protease [Kitasatospora sp. NPDC002040]|uniref:CPBP family glutamic-type intramembrane protease n=1 Tax=Kitasatospora sp. NPDC002040 TaxID=3154661 RepID=UPI0033188118